MAKKNKNKLPEKRTMNLYKNADKGRLQGWKRILVIVLVTLFVVVGIFGRYGLLAYKAIQLKNSEAQLATYESQLTNYKEVKTEYERYTKSYLTAEEKALEDRTTIIVAANNCTKGLGTINSITITGNSAVLNLSLNNLHDVPTIVSNFESFNNIAYVDVANVGRTTGENAEGTAKSIQINAVINYGIGEQTASEGVQ